MCLSEPYFVFHSLAVQRNNFCLCSVLSNMSFHFEDEGLVFIPFVSSPSKSLSVLFPLFHIIVKQLLGLGCLLKPVFWSESVQYRLCNASLAHKMSS